MGGGCGRRCQLRRPLNHRLLHHRLCARGRAGGLALLPGNPPLRALPGAQLGSPRFAALPWGRRGTTPRWGGAGHWPPLPWKGAQRTHLAGGRCPAKGSSGQRGCRLGHAKVR
ncbi:unnamed protein product [Gulo gulo]|uniref:Uncharacterized protein n=1 Tax=Gulo gulo TaxID=48420 RepID=A0A9X9PYQ9_GULGU|nr:unnamed protein product [Gulo gulo]